MTPSPSSPSASSACCGADYLIGEKNGEVFGYKCLRCGNDCTPGASAPAAGLDDSAQGRVLPIDKASLAADSAASFKELLPIEEDKNFPKLLQALEREEGASEGMEKLKRMMQKPSFKAKCKDVKIEILTEENAALRNQNRVLQDAIVAETKKVKDLEQEQIAIMEEQNATNEQYLVEAKKAMKRIADALGERNKWKEDAERMATFIRDNLAEPCVDYEKDCYNCQAFKLLSSLPPSP